MISKTKKIFIDSSIFLAFIDRGDPNHKKATQTLHTIAQLETTLYTSIFNILDTYSIVTREIGLTVGLEFLSSVLRSDMEVLFPQKADLLTAFKILQTNRNRQISLREALVAVLMEKKGINQILTFTYWHSLFGTYVSSLIGNQ